MLLLNATLTVRAHQAASHQRHGWEQFTDAAISALSAEREHLVFILWGGYARSKKQLIDRERLALMKPTALLINCARGPIVDEAALIEALENGRLAGAGLDVTDPEPVAPDSSLFKLPNVIVTPHYAPTTVESATRVSKIAAENINAVLAGKEPVGRIV